MSSALPSTDSNPLAGLDFTISQQVREFLARQTIDANNHASFDRDGQQLISKLSKMATGAIANHLVLSLMQNIQNQMLV